MRDNIGKSFYVAYFQYVFAFMLYLFVFFFRRYGGSINQICWDSSGQRLAISFKSKTYNIFNNFF
jgi:hypothetical protein